jgi:hypothetical protein
MYRKPWGLRPIVIGKLDLREIFTEFIGNTIAVSPDGGHIAISGGDDVAIIDWSSLELSKP